MACPDGICLNPPAMQAEHLTLERRGTLAVLTIRREARRNALHGPLWTALGAAAQGLAADPPRALILTGAGGHFSAGMDLKPDNPLIERLLPAITERDQDVLRALIVELKGIVAAFTELPCPVIAAIEGACAGGGLELALAADLRVAAKDAFFSLPESRVGMMPDVGGTVRLARLVGRPRAAELILTNGKIDAATAHGWGLVNRLAEPGAALQIAEAMAKELSSASPAATREVLGLLRAPQLDLAAETEAGVRVLTAGDVVEGVTSFLEKRPPAWST